MTSAYRIKTSRQSLDSHSLAALPLGSLISCYCLIGIHPPSTQERPGGRTHGARRITSAYRIKLVVGSHSLASLPLGSLTSISFL